MGSWYTCRMSCTRAGRKPPDTKRTDQRWNDSIHLCSVRACFACPDVRVQSKWARMVLVSLRALFGFAFTFTFTFITRNCLTTMMTNARRVPSTFAVRSAIMSRFTVLTEQRYACHATSSSTRLSSLPQDGATLTSLQDRSLNMTIIVAATLFDSKPTVCVADRVKVTCS